MLGQRLGQVWGRVLGYIGGYSFKAGYFMGTRRFILQLVGVVAGSPVGGSFRISSAVSGVGNGI